MTSAPVRAASAATTLESTPPDIATTIRAEAASSRSKFGVMLRGSLLEIHPVRLDRPYPIGGEGTFFGTIRWQSSGCGGSQARCRRATFGAVELGPSRPRGEAG